IAIVTSILYLAPAPTVRSPLSLHDALPISVGLIGAQIASACMKTARRRLPVFRKFTGKARLAVLRRARTTLTEGLGRRVQSPQRFTTCRLTPLPSSVALAGSYPRVPDVRPNWLTKGGRWSKALITPRLACVLASQREPPSN